MKRALLLLLCVVALLSGCTSQKKNVAAKQPSDVIDRDFVAHISKTSDPYVFEVTIKKVNSKVDKQISGLGGMVDLTLTNSSGKKFATDQPWDGAKYAKEVTEVFEWPRKANVTSLTGKVKLIKTNLPPGTYTIEPRARFSESGKDRLSGPCPDGGTVSIPAGNSVEIVL
ncbi:MAG: hypothetical protein NT018_02360 [Armatimonadetes bacterium]|nr:hypothetical protein [Armatimonadota bacterium]